MASVVLEQITRSSFILSFLLVRILQPLSHECSLKDNSANYHLVGTCLIVLHVCSSSMLESVANLKKKSKKGPTAESSAFQQLFLLVGMHLFKVRYATRAMIYSSSIVVIGLLQP